MKKLVSFIVILALVFSVSASALAGGLAVPTQSRAVLGGDLNEQQIAQVYQAFGVQRGTVVELKLTNAEERSYLQGYVSDSLIGTRAISSVYVELLPSGSSMEVRTSNVTWCSPQMYMNALITAGVTDARIIVAAPFEVSGTAALAGVYKAYEDMTGRRLDATAKAVGTQELTVTGELAASIGSLDSVAIVNELKLMLDKTAKMSDEQLRQQIIRIAAGYRVTLTEKQIGQLISLVRSLEALDVRSLRSRVERLQDTLGRASEAKTQVVGFFQSLREAANSVKNFFDRLSALLTW